MKLTIISHTPHYEHEGEIRGWGPTIREIDYLATRFDEVVHIAPLHPETPPASVLPYEAPNVQLHSVGPSGGPTLFDKVHILTFAPQYIRAFQAELSNTDVVHVRCPANISLIALVILALRKAPQQRWFKYAGDWQRAGGESWFYTFQRWWLRQNYSRGQVTVNGDLKNSPAHIHRFFNPSLTQSQIMDGAERARSKNLSFPIKLVFVGGIRASKGVDRILHIARRLQLSGGDFHIDLIGGGPELGTFEDQAQQQGLADVLTFHGWMPRDAVDEFYRHAHFALLPSSTEGWPKVLSEGMAYGVVPLASNVGSIPYHLGEFGIGKALDADDIEGFSNAILAYCENAEQWKVESERAVQQARFFGYEYYLEQVDNLFNPESPANLSNK